ncbi:MAG TPA: energy transducer TonB, partial [Guyparkeria sp.]|nr:energy transducer TonB [Guyparkeria sp.]
YLDNAPPSYPRAAQRLRQEGEVLLRVMVDADGRPIDWSVARSSGHARLDRAAMDAVAKWRFEPATRGGRPVKGEVIVPLDFRLR